MNRLGFSYSDVLKLLTHQRKKYIFKRLTADQEIEEESKKPKLGKNEKRVSGSQLTQLISQGKV